MVEYLGIFKISHGTLSEDIIVQNQISFEIAQTRVKLSISQENIEKIIFEYFDSKEIETLENNSLVLLAYSILGPQLLENFAPMPLYREVNGVLETLLDPNLNEINQGEVDCLPFNLNYAKEERLLYFKRVTHPFRN